jgi:gamma-glutamyl-gamma-aminobutyrate hydrolase PuuD
MTRPLIGITSEMTAAGWGNRVRETLVLPARYTWALERAGCAPVLLPPSAQGSAGLAARLDAVVFSDGGDIDARRCGAGPAGLAPEPDLVRDVSEFALMREAIAEGLPVLAVGRGMRVLNVARGGSVAEREGGPWAGHEVRISPGSRLGRILGPAVTLSAAPTPAAPSSAARERAPASAPASAAREQAPVGRHQALDRLGAGVTAAAWADDQTVLAIELAGHPFAIGVQWHPEDGEDLRIFTELATAAGARTAA